MGKTSKPLWIVLDEVLLDGPEGERFRTLASKGHRVQDLTSASGEDLALCDLILSPKSWRMVPETAKYLDTAIKGAWARVYPAKKGAN